MIKYYIVIDIVGLEFDHLQSDIIPNISRIASEGECAKMEPVFPAVTCPVQASLLSGTYPSEHGIISNGLYDRTNHNISFWEQSSNLVKTDRVWDVAEKNRQQQTQGYYDSSVILAKHHVLQRKHRCHSASSSF